MILNNAIYPWDTSQVAPSISHLRNQRALVYVTQRFDIRQPCAASTDQNRRNTPRGQNSINDQVLAKLLLEIPN